MSLCGTISVLRCHFRGNKMTAVPRWLQRLVLIKPREINNKMDYAGTISDDTG